MFATVHLAPTYLMRMMYTPGGQAALLQGYRAGEFTKMKPIMLAPGTEGEAGAEEMFDLSNNPGRQDERELLYGRGRSVSVGDIVEVEDRQDPEKRSLYLCESMGWKELSF